MGQKMPAFRINISNNETEAKWYTIVTKHNYENKFATNLNLGLKNSSLENNILEVMVPIIEEVENYTGKKGEAKTKIKSTKLYPSYVFVKAIMNEKVWAYLRNTTGCSTILATGSHLATMGDYEIDQIKKLCNMDSKDIINFNGKVGDNIEIINGVFNGLVGKIINISKNVLNIDLPNNIKAEINIGDVKII